MARPKASYARKEPEPRAAKRSFEDLMSDIPVKDFIRMVMHSGLRAPQARMLCESFRELKG